MSLQTNLSSVVTSISPSEQAMINEEFIKKLMLLLDHTSEGCFSCNETYALMDEYAERIMLNQEEAAVLMPLVKKHIDRCPGCQTELTALLQILETD